MEKGFQLRNYHIRRGSRPKDSTPLYPITKAENVIGGAGGVTQVTELPATGEEGKIYYNTTEKKYYIYTTENGFTSLGTSAMPHGEAPENKSQFPTIKAYTLNPNTYYDFDEFYTTDDTITPLPATISFDGLNDTRSANSYVFRMTIPTTGTMNITLNGVIIPDVAREILDNLEASHTYEFNIFEKVLLVTDITSTDSSVDS